jgi:hypothetical protein
MKLRDQLRMHKATGYDWPPIWTNPRKDQPDKPQGEIGNLQDVLMIKGDARVIFIAIEHQGGRYMGAVGLDSAAFCRQIYSRLKSYIGLSIKEIGDIDLP